MTKKTGFTIIELLVVIAVIGLLASIVLTATGDSRKRAADAKIKSQLLNFRSAAGIYYANNGGYSLGTAVAVGVCPGAVSTASIFSDAGSYPAIQVANLPVESAAFRRCYHDGTLTAKANKFLMVVRLVSDTTKAWCIDANANAKEVIYTSYDSAAEVAALSYACN